MRLDAAEDRFLTRYLRSETVGGGIALAAAVVAVLWANFDGDSYRAVQDTELGPLDLRHWAADGALTLFFFVAGLELKRELVVGSLRRPVDAAVPVVAALGGVAVPALLYVGLDLTYGEGEDLAGWAVPAATDIAFALAVLAVVGSALPSALRAFLLTLAVVDDLVVIVIIAVAYTETLDLAALGGAGLALVGYAVCQRLRVRTWVVLVPLALACWWLTHESGVHATVAGVALGLLTRVRPDPDELRSPAERLEHRLSPLSAGVAVPVFALLSAGVALGGDVDWGAPIVVGVLVGLVIGKPLGILAGAWLVTRFPAARIDDELGWRDMTGVAVLGGVGFTVSLLVSDLAFADGRADEAKAAVLVGSAIASVVGALVLRRRNRHHAQT